MIVAARTVVMRCSPMRRMSSMPAEVERFGDEVEHVRSLTTPGDPWSWWSVNAVRADPDGRLANRAASSP